ncbi:hypothetical protein LOTGIDRAFT_155477 [Lottia gigantea]|uniref:Palmitoyltransferase n=1 Tax=Lottia gigantea TaxID=225164 RepID=V3ZIT9_LOTGI|nr:hypothetical protein LOTGIDRAFT_155477 [Lottia gigantea]ESO84152.1 hypothetical protein LOTGIDRAFT_155477 [Lottia gigantea]
MDFLVLFIGYIMSFVIGSILYYFRDSQFLNTGVFGMIKHSIGQAYYNVAPTTLVRWLNKIADSVLGSSNPFMQIMFCLMVLLGHSILVMDVLPYLFVYEPNSDHVTIPAILCFTNFFFMHLSCTPDSGEINSKNQKYFMSLYEPDGIYYYEDTVCKTCNIIRPPRSKHCSTCKKCVHRFDHHCVWTNNCVAGFNQRWFILYLISVCIMCGNGTYMTYKCLKLIVRNKRLMETAYVDESTNSIQPISYYVLIQHLFMNYPHTMFLLFALPSVIILLGSLASYHIYLVCTNQTTNERYKLYDVQRRYKHEGKNASTITDLHSYRPYDKGFIENVKEVMFPKKQLDKLFQKKES